jgi:hypothetical protein
VTLDQMRMIGSGLLFVLIFVSGFQLTRSGRPYGVFLLTVHKLASLAAVGLLVVAAYQVYQADALGATQLVVAVVAILFFLDTMATGGLLSIGNPVPAAILTMHRVVPYVTLLSTAAALYLLLSPT